MTLSPLRVIPLVAFLCLGASACTAESPADGADAAATEALLEACTPPTFEVDETIELVPGLEATLLERGYGRRAIAGDRVSVHYTGWLFDPNAPEKRGNKFDSSLDRDQVFEFPLGAGRVIRGWDQGVECMLIGEKRELIIPPELGYGKQAVGGGLIPANSTLRFEVEPRDGGVMVGTFTDRWTGLYDERNEFGLLEPGVVTYGANAAFVEEVKAVFVVLGKALRAHQLYDENNPVYQRFVSQLAESLAGLWS